MGTQPEELLDELRVRIADLEVEEARLQPALEDAFRMAADEARTDWTADTATLPDVARTIILRGARRILVNPDSHRQEQAGDHLVQMGVGNVFSADEIRRLRGLAPRARVGSLILSRPGLAEAELHPRLVGGGTYRRPFASGYDGAGGGTAAAQWGSQ